MEESDYIWMDDEIVGWNEAKVHVLSHALHYGTAVFEGIRAYEADNSSIVFRLEDHIERLLNSAKIMGFEPDYSKRKLVSAVEEIILENSLTSCYIRPLIFKGYGEIGLNPSKVPLKTMIAAWPWETYLGEESLSEGVDIKTSSWKRHHPNIMPTKAKASGNYVNSVLAKREAVKNGYSEALMLNPEGKVAEGSGENFFMVRNGKLITPPKTSVLEGITRDSIIEIAEDKGMEVEEKDITRDQVYTAEEAFFCGTAAEVTPIRSVDGRKISKSIGETTEEIQNKFMDIVKGRDREYQKWLKEVEE